MKGIQSGKSRDADKYVIRFEPGMRETIKEIAVATSRSMNFELIYLINRGLEVTYGSCEPEKDIIEAVALAGEKWRRDIAKKIAETLNSKNAP